MNKEKLKKIKVLYYPYKLILKLGRVLRKTSRIVQLKPIIHKDNLRVGFIVQLPSIWEKQVDIYNEMLKRDNIEVFLFAVPQYDWKAGSIAGKEIDSYFKMNYPKLVDICRYKNSKQKILDYKLDYLFYPRAYDHYLPIELRSESLYKYIKCCYIPYAMNGQDTFCSSVYSKFMDNISVTYMDTLQRCNLLRLQYPLSTKIGKRKIKYLGYPALYKYLSFGDQPQLRCITWTPRWSTDRVIGGSNFVEFADYFLHLVKNSDYKFIFRPHPLMFDELVTKGIISKEYKENYINELKKYNVVFDITTPIDEIFRETSILITDFSSIIAQFFLTGRPIIYCDKGIKLNKTFGEMIELNYLANNWNDVIKCLNIIADEPTEKINKRREFINKNYRSMGNPSVRIVDDLIKGEINGEN